MQDRVRAGESEIVTNAYDPSIEFPQALTELEMAPGDLAFDGEGTLWVPLFTGTDTGNLLLAYPPEGEVRRYALPRSPGSPIFSGIGILANGEVAVAYGWTVAIFDPKREEFTTVDLPELPATYSEHAPGDGSWVADMAVGADGAIYAVRQNVSSVTRVDPVSLHYNELEIPDSFGSPHVVHSNAAGLFISNMFGTKSIRPQSALVRLDGAFIPLDVSRDVLVSAFATNRNGEVVAAGGDRALRAVDGDLRVQVALEKGDIPSLGGLRDFVAVDSSTGDLWFAGDGTNSITRLSPDGQMRTYELPSFVVPGRRLFGGSGEGETVMNTNVTGIAVSPDGDLYFGSQTLNRIGVIHVD